MNTTPDELEPLSGSGVLQVETGYIPRPLQKVLHNYLRRFNVLVCHRRFGKCLPASVVVPTTEGFKSIKDIRIGDYVYSAVDGKPTRVKGTYCGGTKEIYELVFDTGEKVECDDEHTWYVEPAFSKLSKNKRKVYECGLNMTTKEIMESKEDWFIPLTKSVDKPKKELPIDPYLFGYWLGDGSSDDGFLYVAKGDEHTVESFVSNYEDRGGHYRCYVPKMVKRLKDLNVYKNKNIPDMYLNSSIEQRIALLQGMMDSDGTVGSSGTCRFDNKNESMIDGFLELARSLGLKITKKEYKKRNEFYCLFRRREFDPFRLDRKNKLAMYSHRPIRRKIVGVIKTDKVEEVYCISIEHPSKLFVCSKDYIPTHNTVFAINELIDRALRNDKKNPQYAYIAPTYKQARKIAWKYIKEYTKNIPGVNVLKSELTITIARPGRVNAEGKSEPDEIEIMLLGADDPDALRGLYLDGCILDEYAQCDPLVWGEIVRPALADRKGWAIFIGTPKGRNAFYERYQKAREAQEYCEGYEQTHDILTEIKDWAEFEKKFGIHKNLPQVELKAILKKLNPKLKENYEAWRKYITSRQWFTSLYRASETGILDQDEIEDMIADLSEEEILQELECDFAAAIKGSYYGHLLNKAREDGRVGHIPVNPVRPIDTFWDIGVGDKTTIWFRQKIGSVYNYVHYFEHNGEGVEFYKNVMDALAAPDGATTMVKDSKGRILNIEGRGFRYGRHVWPHDGRVKEFGSGQTRQETAAKLGLKVEIQKKQAIADRIQAARTRIQISFFDEKYCKRGLDCVYNYQKEWDDQKQMFKDKPLHDWSSHGADSFGYSALDDRDSFFPDENKSTQFKTADSDYDELAA